MSEPARVLDLAGASVRIYRDAESASDAAAARIAGAIREAVTRRGKAVLGLATGADARGDL